MIQAMRNQVHQRLHGEAGIHATSDEVAAWGLQQLQEATLWMDALLRRKEGAPFHGDTYDCPEHVRVVIMREACVSG